MNIALSFISLRNEKIRDMSSYPIFIAHGVSAEYLL